MNVPRYLYLLKPRGLKVNLVKLLSGKKFVTPLDNLDKRWYAKG